MNGPIEDILFPINHGILYYPGYTVLPPFVAYRVDRMDEAGFKAVTGQLKERMRTLEIVAPIPYRMQNGGDYQVPSLELRPELGDPGASGFALHVDRKAGDLTCSTALPPNIVRKPLGRFRSTTSPHRRLENENERGSCRRSHRYVGGRLRLPEVRFNRLFWALPDETGKDV